MCKSLVGLVCSSGEWWWELGKKNEVGGEMMGEENEAGGDSGELVKNGDNVARLPKIIPFRELCRCGDEVWIENEGQLYRLRRTKQGKLILTK